MRSAPKQAQTDCR